MSEITRAAIGMPFSMAMESELSRRQFHSIAQALLIERDQLRAEVAGLRTGYEAYERVNAELKAEVEALREEVALGDKIIADRDRLLNMFDCPAHGQCIPYAMEQIEALRKDADKWKIVERAMTQLQSDEKGAATWSACSRILISVAGKMNSARSTVTEEGVTFDGVEAGDWRVTVERINAANQGVEPDLDTLRKALIELLDLYDTDEGCRSLPQYIAGRAALGQGEQS